MQCRATTGSAHRTLSSQLRYVCSTFSSRKKRVIRHLANGGAVSFRAKPSYHTPSPDAHTGRACKTGNDRANDGRATAV